MTVRTGLAIIRQHEEYQEKINELETALGQLEGYPYTRAVLEEELTSLREAIRVLEDTRFQAVEPVVVNRSMLGGTEYVT